MNLSPYKKKTIALLVLLFGMKLLLSGWVELNNDEAYYWTYSRFLLWNYFDHPPMIGLLIYLSTLGGKLHYEIWVRLPAILCGTGSIWLQYQIGRQLKDELTGWLTAAIFAATFYGAIISGWLALPDAPLLFFWLLAIYAGLKLAEGDNNSIKKLGYWLLLGAAVASASLSKADGIFLWLGFGGFVIFNKPAFLREPRLYLSLLIFSILVVPTTIWSLNHKVGAFGYHSSRISLAHVDPGSFFRELAGEAAYFNPIFFIVLGFSIIHFIRQHRRISQSIRLLLWMSIPLILTVWGIAIFNDTLPHWPGPAYATTVPLLAVYLSGKSRKFQVRILSSGAFMIVASLIILIGLIRFYPGTLGKGEGSNLGKDDVTLDMSGWRDFSRQFSKEFPTQNRSLFTNYWFPGGQIDYYLAEPSDMPLRVVGSAFDIHQFRFLNTKQPPLKAGDTAYYIGISNYYDAPPRELLRHFRHVEKHVSIGQFRNGKIARYFYVYRLCYYLGGIPLDGVLY